MKGKHRLINILDTLGVMARENPCGWNDTTLSMIADGISAIVGERTRNGLTMLQVAEYFGVTIRTLERWRRRFGDFPEPIDPYAKTLAFPADKIVSWKMEHCARGDIG